jgi:putative molybdopterin biosynthesis protein
MVQKSPNPRRPTAAPRPAGDSTTMLTTEEIAGLLRVHPKHVYRLIARGLPGRRVGGQWRFDRDEVLRWAGLVVPVDHAAATHHAPSPSSTARPPLLAANGDVLVQMLLECLAARGHLLGWVRSDRDRALASLVRGEVLLAGSHGRRFPAAQDGIRFARIHLARREVGLAAPLGAAAPQLRAMVGRRVAYRPPTAAIVEHVEAALAAAKIPRRRALAEAALLPSHEHVCLALASGRADIGVTTKAWAQRLALPFTTLASEDYGLLLRAEDLADPRVVALCECCRRGDLGRGLDDVAGYELQGSGTIHYDLGDDGG